MTKTFGNNGGDESEYLGLVTPTENAEAIESEDTSILNFVFGHGIPRSLKLLGTFGTSKVHILIDNCSTRKFVQPRAVKRMKLPVKNTNPFKVYIGGSDPEAKYALSKLLQMGTVAEYQNEFKMLINQVMGIPQSLLIPFYIIGLKLHLQRELNLVSRLITLGDVSSLARIVEARFEDTNNQAVDNNGGDKNIVTDKKDHTRIHELEKQVEKLLMELQLKNNFMDALETTSKDLEKKMLNLNPTLHDPQKVTVDQKKKHYQTKYALKIDDEEFKKAKSEATTKIRKLAKVYGVWLTPWLAARLVVFQLYVKNQSKEFLFIQGRIWDPGIKRIFKTSS
nr:myosin heavy chain-related protein [Tanacetum cinerariifolium]